jgi:hypothetical protein
MSVPSILNDSNSMILEVGYGYEKMTRRFIVWLKLEVDLWRLLGENGDEIDLRSFHDSRCDCQSSGPPFYRGRCLCVFAIAIDAISEGVRRCRRIVGVKMPGNGRGAGGELLQMSFCDRIM